MDCSGKSQILPPWTLPGHICRPPGLLASYFQPREAAVGSRLDWPSRHGARPPISSFS